MDLKQDYEDLLMKNKKLKKEIKSKECFISKLLQQKKELNEKVTLLFNDLEKFKDYRAERFHLRTLRMQRVEILKMYNLQQKVYKQLEGHQSL